MKLYSSRKLFIHSDKCWTGSTKVYRQDEVDEQMVSYEFHAEAVAKKDVEIAELVTSLEAMVGFVSIYSDGYYRLHDTEAFKAAEALLLATKEK